VSAIIVPALVIFLCETIRHQYFDNLPHWLGNLISASVALLAASLFAAIIFRIIARMNADLVAQNRRLAAINRLSAVAHQAGGEADLLAAALPVLKGALGAIRVEFRSNTDESHPPAVPVHTYALVHNDIPLGTLFVMCSTSPDPSLLTPMADVLALALANRRLVAQAARIAVLEERDRIARELHDGLAQMLATMTLQSEHGRAVLAGGNVHAARVAFDHIERACSAAYADVREAIVGLRDDLDRDFLTALRETAERFSDATAIVVDMHGDLGSAQLTPMATLQLLRVVQESLTNIRKHASATHVAIALSASADPAQVVLSICDNGIGFDPDHVPRVGRQHFGLLVMRERLESLGGTLTVESAPAHGTTIHAMLPVPAATQSAVA
jgi:signal transduction histidine kinase